MQMQKSFLIGSIGDAVHDAKRTFSIGQAVSEKSANIDMKKRKEKICTCRIEILSFFSEIGIKRTQLF